MNFGNPAGVFLGNAVANAFRDPSPALGAAFGLLPVIAGNRIVNRVDELGDQWVDRVGSAANSLMDQLDPYINSAGSVAQSLLSKLRSGSGSGSGAASGSGMYAPSGSSAAPIYYQAELAERYGMNRETAYSEAMSNTAYQRAVRDMQLAGLNPAVIYGAGRGSTAGNGMVYSSRGSGSGSGRGSSEQEGNLPDAPGWLYYGAQAAANLIGSLATKNTMIGFALGQLAGTAVKAYNGF